jgi:hypothetical protein
MVTMVMTEHQRFLRCGNIAPGSVSRIMYDTPGLYHDILEDNS